MTRAFSGLSGAAVLGCVLAAAGAHLLARSSDGASVQAVAAQTSGVAEEQTSREDADRIAAGTESYRPHAIGFSPCSENATLDCGTLVVPVDYKKPHGETVGIAVIRARATNPAQRIGVLVGNPGGPGVSGVDFVLGGIQAPGFIRLRKRFDIISFDPRGVARSHAVRCAAEFGDVPDNADDATLAAIADDFSQRFARTCLEQNGTFVTKIGTNNVARDIDMLRRALGERQISYAAGSYGSELGATYASLFPERVRAMMLDGAVPPEFRDYLVESASEFSGAFELAFQRLDQVCRRDPSCRLADTGVVGPFDEVAARLEKAPVTAPNGAVLTHFVLQDVIANLLDNERFWPFIVDGLADARAGDYALLFQLLPVIPGELTALVPITCNDYGTRRSAAEYLPVDEAIGALHPRFFGRFFVALVTAPCAAWPAADPPVIRDVRSRIAAPILIIGNDFDSRTSLSDARRLARALGMERSLLRYAGSGHTAFFKTTACIQDTVESYLVDLRVPPEGSVCPGQPISFGSSSRKSGAAAALTGDEVLSFRGALPRRPR